MYAVYAGITVALIAGVAIWAVAYRVGREAGERAALQQLDVATPPLDGRRDPLLNGQQLGESGDREPEPVNGGTPSLERNEDDSEIAFGADAAPTPSRTDRADQPVDEGPRAWVLNHRGELVRDPRRPETNYLKLESGVPSEEAERLLRFLSSRGLEAIAVAPGLEPGEGSSNNPARVSIYSLRGIPSSEWSDRAEQARRLAELVRRLGREWRRSHGGTVALADPLWQKHDP